MWRLCFLAAVDKKPRTLWACHCVTFIISARVDPWRRPISSRILAPLLSARGRAAAPARTGLGFLAARFLRSPLRLSSVGVLCPLGALLLALGHLNETQGLNWGIRLEHRSASIRQLGPVNPHSAGPCS